MAFKLTDEQVRHYRDEGYLLLPSFFGAQELRAVDAATRDLVDRALSGAADMDKVLELEPEPLDGRRVARRVYNPFLAHEAFRRLATDERLLDAAECLIGPDIWVQHSKLNMKPPRVGSVVDWHQDLTYFPHTNDDLISTLIYLDDADDENGCLQVLPRQHREFFDHFLPDGTFAWMITEDLPESRVGKPVALAAPAGSVILMHCVTPHSSLPNRSSRPRRTLIFEYRAADALPIYYGEQAVKDESLARLVRGQPTRRARFGGPRPVIPRDLNLFKSLYARQENARKLMGAAADPKT